jgi:hypothetical protein
MATSTFQVAVLRARASYSDKEWSGLTFAEQSRAIYLMIRVLDAEMIRGPLPADAGLRFPFPPPPPHPASSVSQMLLATSSWSVA